MASCWVYKARERKKEEWWCSSFQVTDTHDRALLSWCSRQLFVVECRVELGFYNLSLPHSICRGINLSSNARAWIKERKHTLKQLTAKRFGQFQYPIHLSECSTNRIKNVAEETVAKTLNTVPPESNYWKLWQDKRLRKSFSHARTRIFQWRIVWMILKKSHVIEWCGGQQKLVECCVIH